MYDIPTWAQNWLRDGNYQDIYIRWEYSSGNTVNIYSKSILSGTFAIDRTCVASETIELGSVIASTMKVTLMVDEISHISDITTGQKMEPYIVLENEGADVCMIPCGKFFISKIEKQEDNVYYIEATDALGWNGDTEMTDRTSGYTLRQVVGYIARELTGELSWRYHGTTEESSNLNATVTSYDRDTSPTLREYLGWIAFLVGCFVRIDEDGRVGFVPLENDIGFSFSEADRYSSKVEEKYGKIKRVIYRAGEWNIIVGSYTPPDPYTTWDIMYTTEIPLTFSNTMNDMISGVLDVVDGFEWRPLDMVTYSAPFILPGDRIIYTSTTLGNLPSMVTSVNYQLNKNTTIKCAKPQSIGG